MTVTPFIAGLPWPWVFALSLALAVGSAFFLLLEQAADLGWRIYCGKRIGGRSTTLDAGIAGRQSRSLPSLVPVMVALPAAVFLSLKSPLVAGCIVALAVVLSRYLEWRRSRARLAEVNEELEKMVTVLHSAYLVRPVVAPALEEAIRSIQGPLREAVERTIREIWVGSNPKEAYSSLGKALANPYLAQLGLILERAEESSPVQVGQALRELATRLRQRKRLQARVKATMSMLSGTVRFLQGANALAIVIVLATPTLRDFYFESLQRQALFGVALTVVLGTSLFFDQRLSSLKERII